MGLDVSHDCWHGAYSSFMRWRQKIAEVAGLPPLDLMEGFWGEEHPGVGIFLIDRVIKKEEMPAWMRSLPIKWECLKPDPIHKLLNHSDCDGEIAVEDCGPISDSLERLIPLLPEENDFGHIGNWRDKTRKFVEGLRLAASKGENVEFH